MLFRLKQAMGHPNGNEAGHKDSKYERLQKR
jgi:hypothetical protein